MTIAQGEETTCVGKRDLQARTPRGGKEKGNLDH